MRTIHHPCTQTLHLGPCPRGWLLTMKMPGQRGVDLPSLDVTYFTSLSYYILLLFGLNGLMRMLFREQARPLS